MPVVEVEDRVHRDQVHVRVVVGVERPDVAPVAAVALGDCRGTSLSRSRRPARGRASVSIGHDVAAHVVHGGLVGGVAPQRVEQHIGGEDVVAHRGEDLVGGVRQAGRVGGFSRNASIVRPSAPVWMTPNSLASVRGTRMPATVTPGAARDVLLDHLARVHAVDVVGAEHHDVVGLVVVDQVQATGRWRRPIRGTTAGPSRCCAGTGVT